MRKTIESLFTPPEPHWVGNGFPVRSLFNYAEHGARISPFLLLDHAGPTEFAPGNERRGVGAHPHRGFETVTIVYAGEVAHRDSCGAGGTIGPDEVQWMTAAAGLLHDEFHTEAFTRRGGPLEMVQLWVNLPARHKMDAPHYQALTRADIPEVALPGGAGVLRVIAGDYAGHAGAAQTYTPINLWDMRLRRGGKVDLTLPEGHTLMLLMRKGSVRVEGERAHAGQLLQLSRSGTGLALQALTDAELLLMGGEPIAEPVAGYGPFVMNTRAELTQAFEDFNAGKFGQMPASADAAPAH